MVTNQESSTDMSACTAEGHSLALKWGSLLEYYLAK